MARLRGCAGISVDILSLHFRLLAAYVIRTQNKYEAGAKLRAAGEAIDRRPETSPPPPAQCITSPRASHHAQNAPGWPPSERP